VNNQYKEGNELEITAPGGGLVGGQTYVKGTNVGVVAGSLAAGEVGILKLRGMFTLVTDTGTAWTQGDKVYFATGAATWTKTATSNLDVGATAGADKASGTAVGLIVLPGGSTR